MKKFTVLVALALLAVSGTGYATDRVAALPTVGTVVTVAPAPVDRQAIMAMGIDSTLDESTAVLPSNIPPMFTREIAGKWGIVTVVSMSGVKTQVLLRSITPCRLVDTHVDGGPFVDGEVRKYLIPDGFRCTGVIPRPTAPGTVVLLNVKLVADEYRFMWGDSGPKVDFIGSSYSPDWFTMHGERGFLFASAEPAPNVAAGEIQGFVALKSFPYYFSPLWGVELQFKSEWSPSARGHVVVDIVGYAVPNL